MDFVVIEDRELALDSKETLPLESLKAHFGPNATSSYYITDERRESAVSTH